MTIHKYSDKELAERITTLAKHLNSEISQIHTSDNPLTLQFSIEYANESFFSDFLEVRRDQAVGWFIKDGLLNVYRSNEAQNN